ncbi:MAG TPA: YkvA family protein [Gammaproteobacteria bacterium]|nr:YkvA family protein [Gammaproteobacteria bacterium]
MPLRVTFDLGDEDLKHFQLIMREARNAVKDLDEDTIVAAANVLLSEIRSVDVPQFILERLAKLETMIGMVTDEEWKLPPNEKTRVLNALAYFGEPEDLIPDHIPGLGFLDDAIMIELVVRELKHEIDAYVDFCTFRSVEEQRRRQHGMEVTVTREEWLRQRRHELHSRMRRRRRRERSRGSRGRSPFSLL